MTTVIQIKQSDTASSVPTTSDLQVGEVAVNTADQKIYVRSTTGVVEVANAAGAGGASVDDATALAIALG